MKGKTRYIFLICGIPILLFFHWLFLHINEKWTENLKHPNWKWRNERPRGLYASNISSLQRRNPEKFNTEHCRMETCFDFSKCIGKDRAFKVYVYPEDILGGQQRPSESYEKVNNDLSSGMYNLHDQINDILEKQASI